MIEPDRAAPATVAWISGISIVPPIRRQVPSNRMVTSVGSPSCGSSSALSASAPKRAPRAPMPMWKRSASVPT